MNFKRKLVCGNFRMIYILQQMAAEKHSGEKSNRMIYILWQIVSLFVSSPGDDHLCFESVPGFFRMIYILRLMVYQNQLGHSIQFKNTFENPQNHIQTSINGVLKSTHTKETKQIQIDTKLKKVKDTSTKVEIDFKLTNNMMHQNN